MRPSHERNLETVYVVKRPGNGTLLGMTFIAVLLFLFAIGSFHKYESQFSIEKSFSKTKAKVVMAEQTSVEVTVVHVVYEYFVDGKRFESKDVYNGRVIPSKGENITIEYSLKNPSLSYIEGGGVNTFILPAKTYLVIYYPLFYGSVAFILASIGGIFITIYLKIFGKVEILEVEDDPSKQNANVRESQYAFGDRRSL